MAAEPGTLGRTRQNPARDASNETGFGSANGPNQHYLPATVSAALAQATGCYAQGLLAAFATMCRLTVQAALDDLGQTGRQRVFDLLEEARELAELDTRSFSIVRRTLIEADSAGDLARLQPDREEAAVLMEILRDLLYQLYIRPGKLRGALWMRSYFAQEKQRQT